MQNRVDAFAKLCLPDFIYPSKHDPDAARNFLFRDILPDEGIMAREIHDIESADIDLSIVGISLDDVEDTAVPYVFTHWARGQLLSHLGTREKWFRSVSMVQQADELNARRHTFAKHKLRLMDVPGSPVRVVRGLVSSQYAEIPDTEVVAALLACLPDGVVIDRYSGKTDRAFYAYVVSPQEISIPGTSLRAHPGVVLKNSEVGYTALWLIPKLWFPRLNAVMCFPKLPAFKRIHRGDVGDLRDKFAGAIFEVAQTWADLGTRLEQLSSIHFGTEELAVTAMKKMLVRAGSSKLFAYRCEQAYQVAQNDVHSGETVLAAILQRVGEAVGEDSAHDHSAIAGAVLLMLV